jgi:hypothetical protein
MERGITANLYGSRWHVIRCFQFKAVRMAPKRHGRSCGFFTAFGMTARTDSLPNLYRVKVLCNGN